MDPKSILKEYFGFETYRPGQEEIISSILAGMNVVAILPTGGGKSLCYQIPALLADRYSIVISPLIALMKDQVDSLNRSGIAASFINSSLDYASTEKVLNDIHNNKVKLLYISPEKLENTSFTERIKNFPPEYLFIDEAHCISEWGHNFRPSYRKIINFIKYTGISRISAFTATATEEVRTDIISQLDLQNVKIFVRGFERNNIALNVIRTTKKKEKVLDLIKNRKTPAIIYASTRDNCEEISFYLNSHGMNTAYYHAGLTSELRKLIQDDFLENRVDVISATNAFGMGIDKSNIRLIIHYNMPGSIENYYQEFGRAGRDGSEADVFLLYDKKDEAIQHYFIDNSYPSTEIIKNVYNALCDSVRLALGNTFPAGINVDQNLLALISQKGINKSQFENSLSILESSGCINRNSDYEKGHFLQITLPRERLEPYMKSFTMNRFRDILVILLRMYGADILNKKVRINFPKICEELSLDKKNVSELLSELANLGIILYDKPSNFPSVSITTPRVKADELALDTEKFELLTNHMNNKLKSIIDYVNAEECRFRVILKYFGEDAGNYKCGKCDICVSPAASDRIALDFFQEKVLETIHESEGKLRTKVLVDILKGKDRKRDYSVYSNFGCARHFSKEEIEASINYLISQESIIEFNGMLALSDKGKAHFSSEPAARPEVQNNYEDRLKLFNMLRTARKEASVKFSQPLHLICSDELLKKISEIKPLTPASLMGIEGFNQRMFNKIGEEFLSIIKEAGRENKPAETAVDSRFELKGLVQKKYKLEEIASLTKIPEAVLSIQIESLIKFDESVDIKHLFSGSELKQINEKIDAGLNTLKELKEALPSSISYGKIRIALAGRSI